MRQVGRVELLREGVSRQTRGLDHPRSRPPFFLFIRPCLLLQLSRARKYTERVRRINDCCKRARNDGAGQYELTEPAPPGRKQDSREGRSLQGARVVRGCKPIGVRWPNLANLNFTFSRFFDPFCRRWTVRWARTPVAGAPWSSGSENKFPRFPVVVGALSRWTAWSARSTSGDRLKRSRASA
jgi:hypothetical protein